MVAPRLPTPSFPHPLPAHLIECDKKSEIVQYFQGRLCDKLCDFLRANLQSFTGFKGEKSLLCCLTGNLNVKE